MTYRAYNRLRNGSRTVGAAAIVLNARDDLLMVRLSYRSGRGLPGGFCARGEDPHLTASRELLEEALVRSRAPSRRP